MAGTPQAASATRYLGRARLLTATVAKDAAEIDVASIAGRKKGRLATPVAGHNKPGSGQRRAVRGRSSQKGIVRINV